MIFWTYTHNSKVKYSENSSSYFCLFLLFPIHSLFPPIRFHVHLLWLLNSIIDMDLLAFYCSYFLLLLFHVIVHIFDRLLLLLLISGLIVFSVNYLFISFTHFVLFYFGFYLLFLPPLICTFIFKRKCIGNFFMK